MIHFRVKKFFIKVLIIINHKNNEKNGFNIFKIKNHELNS